MHLTIAKPIYLPCESIVREGEYRVRQGTVHGWLRLPAVTDPVATRGTSDSQKPSPRLPLEQYRKRLYQNTNIQP